MQSTAGSDVEGDGAAQPERDRLRQVRRFRQRSRRQSLHGRRLSWRRRTGCHLERRHQRPGGGPQRGGENRECDLTQLSECIKRTVFKITRAGELIGRELAANLGIPFGIVDISLASTTAPGDSVARVLEAFGLEHIGTHGSTLALALLMDAVKKGGAMASGNVGGLSGTFIPVSEDSGMIEAVMSGALSLDKLEALTAVCSVGLDMFAIPGDTPAETIAAIIADELAIGIINDKTTAVRVIPAPGKQAGDLLEFGGLLGSAPVMQVSKLSAAGFMRRGGRLPAPVTSLRN